MRHARPFAVLLSAALSLSGVSAAADTVPRLSARPLKVMSINECTDQIVLALLPPSRIASVTWLSRDPQTSQMAAQAAKVGINHGLSEEVLRERPDLVIAGTYTTTATRGMLKTLGWPLLEIGPADTVKQIRDTTRQIAQAVGEKARGEALLARMDRQIAALARDPGPPLRIAAWDGSGFSAGQGTLYDTVLKMAGAINIAADPAVAKSGTPDTELLLAAAPALLVHGGSNDSNALRANTAQSSIVRRFWGPDRSLSIRQAYYLCGTPFVADEAFKLRSQLRAAAAAARVPLPFASRAIR